MTDITIPPEAAHALQDFLCDRHGVFLEDADIRAAWLALIRAWPGAVVFNPLKPGAVMPLSQPTLILPLSENPNDKA